MIIFFFSIYGMIIGASLGSFIACAVYRLPRGLSLRGRSFCPNCKQKIKITDNIPVFSWLFLKGKSSCCQQPISAHYFIHELSGAIVGVVIGYFFASSLF